MLQTLRLSSKSTWIATAIAIVALKVLATILLEYRWYFPADFSRSFFLSGHRHTFTAAYATAFYTHIISGPFALLVGSYLIVSMNYRNGIPFPLGRQSSAASTHRVAGRVLAVLVIGCVFPSGMVMAQHALAGPIAGWGFRLLAFATAACMVAAIFHASRGDLHRHQQWATRCYLLLISPLLLRLLTGVTIATKLESNRTYQVNAWVSWLFPLIAYEIWRRFNQKLGVNRKRVDRNRFEGNRRSQHGKLYFEEVKP